jgi:hypothetical protein
VSNKFEVTRGTRLEPEAAKAVLASGDYSAVLTQPPGEEVEGQYLYGGWVQCPACGQVGWSPDLDSTKVNHLRCSCGCAFTV